MSDKKVEAIEELARRLSIELVDQGKIIEGGWIALRTLAAPASAPQVQIDEMRMAFFAGAQHLFASIMTVLDPGEEPTEHDLRRLDLIHTELEKFKAELHLRLQRTKGSA